MATKRYTALVLPPDDRLADVCSPRCRKMLLEQFDAKWNTTGSDYDRDALSGMIHDAEVVLTSWGSPNIDESLLDRATKLKFVGHAAGTVKRLVPGSIFDRGIRVFSAAPRIAQSVAEYCLAVLLASMRRLTEFDSSVRRGDWKNTTGVGVELSGKSVGIVSASSTARGFIELLRPFKVQLLIYDPFLSEEEARRLGATKASLEQVMGCPVISVHAPTLPETEGMITKEHLRMIPDGAFLINSSRASVIDEAALITELKTGRFRAALDVYTKEPLPASSPLLSLENVLLTPHIAGHAVEGHQGLMEAVVSDILAAIEGRPTRYEVKKDVWQRIA